MESLEEAFLETAGTYEYVNPDPDANKPAEKPNYAEDVVSKIEAEYSNQPDVAKERREHREHLSNEIKRLGSVLKGIKNVKNHRMKTQNTKNAEKRKGIKMQIANLKEELYAIETEEKGAGVTSNSLVDATVLGTPASQPKTAQDVIMESFSTPKLF